jgi:hypothetical protein
MAIGKRRVSGRFARRVPRPAALARYSAQGEEIAAAPTTPSVTPCSPPSRRGLSRAEFVKFAEQRPSLTAAALGVTGPGQVGTWRNRGTGIVLVPATPMERYHVQEQSVCRPRCVPEGNVDLRHR